MYRFISLLMSASLLFTTPVTSESNEPAKAKTESSQPKTQGISVSAPSALLMEASTGSIIYEKKAHTSLRPASITKIMTLILIFDALKNKKITLEDTVTVSEYAASMGGSQVFLEPGETQTVDTMIKCIAVASANDACVAMAELISGSEQEFVAQMNSRAKGLGMENTNFLNCCGLDADGHVTSAYDVALMSRELITLYPQIHDYSTIWMDTITHVTKRGDSEFGLANTNKLIRQYEYATGLKTGSTSLAKYCVSGTATKDGLDMIAVIMAAPDYKVRFADAINLLNYGFSKCQVYQDDNMKPLPDLTVLNGAKDKVSLSYKEIFKYLDTKDSDFSAIKKEIQLPDSATAPISKNETVGKVVYTLDGVEIGRVDLIFAEAVEAANFQDYLFKMVKKLLL
jgi:D-alanyl-D-alanine carboxypeptidase (penicillin-binding protein 5/6)